MPLIFQVIIDRNFMAEWEQTYRSKLDRGDTWIYNRKEWKFGIIKNILKNKNNGGVKRLFPALNRCCTKHFLFEDVSKSGYGTCGLDVQHVDLL